MNADFEDRLPAGRRQHVEQRELSFREPNLDWVRRGIKLGVMFKIRWTFKAGRNANK
jgi:hypothetical protein